jgi:hypothetical protein
MNKNERRVGGFTIVYNHHTIFVAEQSVRFADRGNCVTVKGSPTKPSLDAEVTSYGVVVIELK